MLKRFLKRWAKTPIKSGLLFSLVAGLDLSFLFILASFGSLLLSSHQSGRYNGIFYSFYYEVFSTPKGMSFKAGLTGNPLILLVTIGGVFIVFLLGKKLLNKKKL